MLKRLKCIFFKHKWELWTVTFPKVRRFRKCRNCGVTRKGW